MAFKAKITLECGRCGNVQRREITPINGLIELPTYYCGKCTRSCNLSQLSSTMQIINCEESPDNVGGKIAETKPLG